jgi:hypothetical protein
MRATHVSTALYAAASLFVLLIVMSGAGSAAFAAGERPAWLLLSGASIAVGLHLVLFPVVAALPVPPWARAAGYGWLVIDIASSIMLLNGVPEATAAALRYGGHIPAAVWVAAVAWQTGGLGRAVGALLAAGLAGYSFAAPWVPETAFRLIGLLLIVWLTLLARTVQGQGRDAASAHASRPALA